MFRVACLRRLPGANAVCSRRSLATVVGDAENGAEAAQPDRMSLVKDELYTAEQYSFSQRINQEFKDIAWLDQALTHKSTRESTDNGRLSVLGKTLARTYVAEALFFRMPKLPAVCCEELVEHCAGDESLFRIGRQTGILSAIRKRFVGKSENGFKDDIYKNVVGGCVAAVVGAIYTDRGPQEARRFVHEFCLPNASEKDIQSLISLDVLPRETLRDISVRHSKPAPTYRILTESGVQTSKPTITVGVFVDGDMLGDGTAHSQILAAKEAARSVLSKFYLQELDSSPLPSEAWEEDDLVMNGKKEVPLLRREKPRPLAANYP